MLQWTAGGSGARFMGIVHHTDAEREWAYDRNSHIGKLDKALDEGTKRGWTIVDMKRDWKKVFPFEREATTGTKHAGSAHLGRSRTDPKDVKQVHALQDAIKVIQKNPGKFEVPSWDQASQKKVRDALLVLASTLPDAKRMFGTKAQVDPVRRLIGAASGLGRQSRKGSDLSQRHARQERWRDGL